MASYMREYLSVSRKNQIISMIGYLVFLVVLKVYLKSLGDLSWFNESLWLIFLSGWLLSLFSLEIVGIRMQLPTLGYVVVVVKIMVITFLCLVCLDAMIREVMPESVRWGKSHYACVILAIILLVISIPIQITTARLWILFRKFEDGEDNSNESPLSNN